MDNRSYIQVFLSHGVRVVAVKDLGLEAEIEVTTALSPNYFNENYRQTPFIFT